MLADDVDIPEGRRRRILRRADLLEQRARRLGPPGTPDSSTVLDSSAVLLLAGMSDRIAQRRGDGGGRYVLRHGGSVRLDPDDPLARHPFLLIAAAGGTRGPAAGAGTSGAGAAFPGAGRVGATEGIDLAARLAVGLPTALLPGGDTMLNVFWDPGLGEDGDVSARVVERLDALELRSRPASDADLTADLVIDALLDGVRHRGFVLLGRVAEARSLQHRVAFCRRELGEDWPDLSDDTLLADLRGWLEPFLAGSRRRRDLQQVDTRAAWFQLLSRPQQASIDRMAPAEVTIPTGRRVRLDYQPDQPVLAVKVQELFGLAQLPTLADGRSRIMAHLLSPAGRPVAVTDDLARFWANGYRQVRTELRGRYPKHPWPEDPLSAPATAATDGHRPPAGPIPARAGPVGSVAACGYPCCPCPVGGVPRAGLAIMVALSLGTIACTGSTRRTEAADPSAERSGETGSGNGRADGATLEWASCDETQLATLQCATLSVPLDPGDAAGATIELALARKPAGDQRRRIGSLLVNPGGPGASGVDLVPQLAAAMSSSVLDRFDLVGFDPRGVARSAPLRCIDDPAAANALDGDPDTQAEIDAVVQLQQDVLQNCLQRHGDLLVHLSTADAAHDLDAIRRAVGDDDAHLPRLLLRHGAGRDLRHPVPGPDPGAWCSTEPSVLTSATTSCPKPRRRASSGPSPTSSPPAVRTSDARHAPTPSPGTNGCGPGSRRDPYRSVRQASGGSSPSAISRSG